MIFSNNILEMLSKVNSVTNSAILRYPKTVVVSESNDIMIGMDLSKLGSDEFPEIGLNGCLGEFISVFKLFKEDRQVDVQGNTINISDDNIKSSYITSSIQLMEQFDKSPEQIEKTKSIPGVATFDITSDDMKKIKDASGVFKDLSELLITSRDGGVNLSLASTNKFNARSNTFSIAKDAQTSKEFEIKLPIENIKMIPATDYECTVVYNSAKDAYRILLISKQIEGFEMLLSVKL